MRLEGWPHGMDSRPWFETRAKRRAPHHEAGNSFTSSDYKINALQYIYAAIDGAKISSMRYIGVGPNSTDRS